MSINKRKTEWLNSPPYDGKAYTYASRLYTLDNVKCVLNSPHILCWPSSLHRWDIEVPPTMRLIHPTLPSRQGTGCAMGANPLLAEPA